ncbi:exonuclease domain-containing protein [Bdellovibrio reynosensis]|uniref:GIY-YIG nuclease family protein n=1 Tax=Bdellovibrio reynosensis TaxID=2835041 RepID=A0ABY4C4M3_9BACT|nr:exonuclease domain-containing protein [Bdellovibrio reynosensis]UOE99778.1 GIY-YIG nuclease family protein [Bdellovibrio reynosensis]
MSLLKHPVLFLDLQTTGAKPESGNILEIAWGVLSSEQVTSYLVEQPDGEEIPRRIQFITGIYQKHMNEAKPFTQVFAELKDFIKEHCLENPVAVIHFAQFEKPFLADAYEKLTEELPFQILCTHEIAKRLLPNLPTRGIKGLAGYFGCPSGELKRAANHVQATQVIWQGLTGLLAEKNILSLSDLNTWLSETPKTARVKYEYPLPKEKRLSLPKEPGVYRMLSRWGEVLYVGKATSLHDRVNSYFRGQKNRDSRKLEMLTQVWDLQVTVVGSPLESALLETDEIKRLNPPYNVSLKVGRRELAFFNEDFTSLSPVADEIHQIGPFSNAMALDSVLRLSQSVKEQSFDENMFYEPIDAELLEAGFDLFCDRHGFSKEDFRSVRSVLAVGLNWYRKLVEEAEEEEIIEEPEEAAADTETEDEEEVEIELTAEDLADKYERHFIRSAATYLRTKKLTQLLNARIKIAEKMELKIQGGQVLAPQSQHVKQRSSWQNLGIDTYDRMTVLYTELNKLRSKNETLEITF